MDNNSSVPNPDKRPTDPVQPHAYNKGYKSLIIVLVLGVIAITVVNLNKFKTDLYPYSAVQTIPHSSQQTNNSTTTPSNNVKGSIVIYSKTTSYSDTNNRRWPTETIFRKVNDGQPENLVTVGKVGEYPNSFELSPDKKSLLINLESKLQVLDLVTKELKDLVIAKEQIETFVFSPDGTKLFIWDQKYVGSDNYFVHIYDLTSKTDKIVAQGKAEYTFLRGKWRNDDKVILSLAAGEYSEAWYFDLNTNKLVKSSGPLEYGVLSEDGKLMAVSDTSIDDVCNDFSGSAVSTYRIVEPITGKGSGIVGDNEKNNSVIAFSPDNQTVLYSSQSTAIRREDCEKEQKATYFVYNFSKKTVTPVENHALLLEQWGQYKKGVVIEYNMGDYSKVQRVSFNGNILANFDNEDIRFITAYKNQ